MNPGPLLFLGTFLALATSWLGFVLVPQLQIGGQPQYQVEATGEMYPSMRPGLARQGEQVYRANGCFYCHSQQVRPKGFGSDVEREWGGRSGKVQSVDRDYLFDRPAMLGSQRIGPDLANIGLRQTNAMLLLLHLYNPRITVPGSVMPPYRFLFENRKLSFGEKVSPEALPNTGVAADYEVVPTDDARTLVAYLLSLHSDVIIEETPTHPSAAVMAAMAAAATNAPPAGTNSPGATNATTNAAAPAAQPPTNAPAK